MARFIIAKDFSKKGEFDLFRAGKNKFLYEPNFPRFEKEESAKNYAREYALKRLKSKSVKFDYFVRK
jgi:hypothetical protein